VLLFRMLGLFSDLITGPYFNDYLLCCIRAMSRWKIFGAFSWIRIILRSTVSALNTGYFLIAIIPHLPKMSKRLFSNGLRKGLIGRMLLNFLSNETLSPPVKKLPPTLNDGNEENYFPSQNTWKKTGKNIIRN